MKLFNVAAAFVVAFLAGTAAAQIPVTDVASITRSVANQVETVAKWQMQYEQMTNQINQMRQQYTAVTGSRGMGNILNNAALRDYLPRDWQGVYDSVKSGGYSGLSGRASAIYNAQRVFDACAQITLFDQRRACEARAVKPSQDQAFALDAYDMAKSRLNQIDGLMGQINATSDPKSIAELQGRIAAEQAMIQNEQTKLQLYQMVAQAEDKIQQQQKRERQAKTWAAEGGIQATPLTFERR